MRLTRTLAVAAQRGWTVALAMAVGCATNPAPLRPDPHPPDVSQCVVPPCLNSVVITSLGVAGFVIRANGSAIMTSPSFTHPSLARVLFHRPIEPDAHLIDSLLSPVSLTDVQATLVGHSHYDHLLDAPYVAATKTRSAPLYGSPTMVNLLATDTRLHLAVIPADSVGDSTRAGAWYYTADRRFRFMALHSSHAPNIGSYTIADRIESSPRPTFPRVATDWSKGEVYEYIIDVLANDSPVFRIFFQDAAAEPQYAVLPPSERGRLVNVAIICAGNFGNATLYPLSVLTAVQPLHVIVGHWEDFFRAPLPPFFGIPLNDIESLASSLDASLGPWRWVTPIPFASVTYRY